MNGEAAARAATTVGLGSGAIGLVLLRAPGAANRMLGLAEDGDGAMCVIALADIALAPAIIVGRPRWPWMLARAGLNLAIGRYLLGRRPASSSPSRPLLATLALGAVTVGDLRIAGALRAAPAPHE